MSRGQGVKCPVCGLGIDEHPASRCLDAWIAESVMGISVAWDGDEPIEANNLYQRGFEVDGHRLSDLYYPVNFYSTDISAAWEAALRLREEGWLVTVELMPEEALHVIQGSVSEYDDPHPSHTIGQGLFRCECQDVLFIQCGARFRGSSSAMACTAPLAICRAALKVMSLCDKTALLDTSPSSVV